MHSLLVTLSVIAADLPRALHGRRCARQSDVTADFDWPELGKQCLDRVSCAALPPADVTAVSQSRWVCVHTASIHFHQRTLQENCTCTNIKWTRYMFTGSSLSICGLDSKPNCCKLKLLECCCLWWRYVERSSILFQSCPVWMSLIWSMFL